MINLVKEIVSSVLPPLKRADNEPERLVKHYKKVEQASTPEAAINVSSLPPLTERSAALGYDPRKFFEHNYKYQQERCKLICAGWGAWIGINWKLVRNFFGSNVPVSKENLVLFSQDFLIKKKKATSTYVKIRIEFRKYLEWLIKNNFIGPDAMSLMGGFRHVTIVTPKKPLITEEEYHAFRKAVQGTPYYYFLTLLWTYGIRRGDAVYLKWESIDWNTKTIRFVPWKTRKKNSQPVELPFTDEIEFMLRALKNDPYNQIYVCNALAKNGYSNASDNVCVTLRELIKIRAKLNFRGVHIFRHTRASRMLNAKDPVDIYTAGEILGISDLKTLQRYVRVSPDNKKKAVSL